MIPYFRNIKKSYRFRVQIFLQLKSWYQWVSSIKPRKLEIKVTWNKSFKRSTLKFSQSFSGIKVFNISHCRSEIDTDTLNPSYLLSLTVQQWKVAIFQSKNSEFKPSCTHWDLSCLLVFKYGFKKRDIFVLFKSFSALI